MPIPLEGAVSEEERLSQNGFTEEEIVALFRLRQWYQIGGREHIVMLRHWEFLKMLVNTGKLEALTRPEKNSRKIPSKSCHGKR